MTIEGLKARIRAEVNNVPREAIENTIEEFGYLQFRYCLAANGVDFQHHQSFALFLINKNLWKHILLCLC